MKPAFTAIAAALAGTAAPAWATSGYSCAPVSGAGPRLSLVVGHAVGPAIVSATIHDGARLLSSASRTPTLSIAQSWIDGEELRIDLADRDMLRFEGRLRARFAGIGRPAIGTFTRNGRVQRVRCVES